VSTGSVCTSYTLIRLSSFNILRFVFVSLLSCYSSRTYTAFLYNVRTASILVVVCLFCLSGARHTILLPLQIYLPMQMARDVHGPFADRSHQAFLFSVEPFCSSIAYEMLRFLAFLFEHGPISLSSHSLVFLQTVVPPPMVSVVIFPSSFTFLATDPCPFHPFSTRLNFICSLFTL
jgi:hypothetical protein